MRVWRAGVVGLLALTVLPLAAGCGLTRVATRGDRVWLPAGRALVVARTSDSENRATAEAAADLLVRELDRRDVVAVRQVLAEATAAGAGVWAGRLLDRLHVGGWTTAEENMELFERVRVVTIVAIDVTAYDQVWGRTGKFTRVSLNAEAFHTPLAKVVWKVRRDIEVESMRGRAFTYALESAVGELASAVDPMSGLSLVNAWRYFNR
jgi:hypothetical protein